MAANGLECTITVIALPPGERLRLPVGLYRNIEGGGMISNHFSRVFRDDAAANTPRDVRVVVSCLSCADWCSLLHSCAACNRLAIF